MVYYTTPPGEAGEKIERYKKGAKYIRRTEDELLW